MDDVLGVEVAVEMEVGSELARDDFISPSLFPHPLRM